MCLKSKIMFFKKKKAWRKRNKHNRTFLGGTFNANMSYIAVGKESYGEINVLQHNKDAKMCIGNFCSIATNVMFILQSDHPLDHISTFPFKAWHFGQDEAISKGDIVVDDDVWIGYNATILSGVHIGQGAVIAAGTVVTKDVPPYAIVAGVPAKVIKYRFDENMINELLKIDYSRLDKEQIKKHINDLYSPLYKKEQLEWMPKFGNKTIRSL